MTVRTWRGARDKGGEDGGEAGKKGQKERKRRVCACLNKFGKCQVV